MIPIFYPVDTDDYNQACDQLRVLGDYVDIKVGPVFIYAHSTDACINLQEVGATRRRQLFVDAKIHDIPSVMAGSMRSIIRTAQPDFVTVHASDGTQPLLAVVDAANQCQQEGYHRPKILGVTVLTSVTDSRQLALLEERASDARMAGLDGLVCATEDIGRLRTMFQEKWPDLFIMTPGIYESGPNDDQQRTGTPRTAVESGASGLVIGRLIRTAADPLAKAQAIRKELDLVVGDPVY